MIVFDWDEDKNEVNRAKHGIDFETAIAAFDDPYRLILFDTEHSGQ